MNTDTTTVQPRISRPQSMPPRRPGRRPVARWIVAGPASPWWASSWAWPAWASPRARPPAGARRRWRPVGAPVTSPTELDVDQPAAILDQTGDTPDPDQPDVDQPEVLDQTGDTPDVEEPQPPVEPLPATLSVTPDPVHLKTGVYSGSITVANVGDEAMHWEALTKPWVSLSDTTGDLGAHGENVITFTIDESQLDAGSFTFKIKVWGDGGTEYVDVTGAKPITEISI